MMGIVPIVTATLNSPDTILSMFSSIASSVVCALFMVQYDSLPMPRLKRFGSLTIKFRY